ncbi:MAG TPA: hypothetical protein VFA64_03645 [Hyphomicrobiaceae bacterium]|nr:hypothetical protein [Hyphomicrobiaceae bacterium]
MMQTFLFDDMGDMWDAKSRSLAEALGASLSADQLAKYAVRNLGFIAASDNDGSISLRLRPAVVSQTALGALIYWLHDRPVERVLISCLDGEWSHELVSSRDETVRRLLSHAKVDMSDRQGDFLRRPRPLADLPHTSPLRALLEAWNQSGGRFDRERLNRVLDTALRKRFLLVEGSATSSHMLVKEIGTGFENTAVRWLSPIKGLRVEDQPDYAYGQWISSIYREAAAKSVPTLEDVDAVIRWPEHPRVSYRYQRLMVPFEASDDSTLVLGVTLPESTIDLRVKSN